MRPVLFLLLGAHLACAETHSHHFFITATSGIADFPEFVALAMVDGQQINYYDSKNREVVPKQEWVKGAVDPDFWNRNTQILTGTESSFKINIGVVKERFNQSGGVHTVQWMYGCELDDDGTKRGYMQYAFDGEDFLSLDKSTRTWTAAKDQAVATKNKWDSTGAEANVQTNYLENTCIEWLQKYVGYGKSTLERKVSPQVSLRQKSSSSSVVCHAIGFYPKEVTISWQKNGQDHDEDVDLGELLPNEDGTFQKTSTLNVKPDELKKNEYSCVVEHQGKTIREILTDDSLPIGLIVGVVVAVLLLAVIGVVVFKVLQKKKKPDFKPVNASDDGSNNS